MSGFTTSKEFTDELNALNNRALSYEVIAYDKLLNKVGSTKDNTANPLAEIKIEYDGTINKANFTANSNMINSKDGNEYEAEDVMARSVDNIIDGKLDTVFNGDTRKIYNNGTSSPAATDNATPYITIDLNESLPICGLRYTAGTENGARIANTISKYNIYTSLDNQNWKKVRSGTFKFDSNNQAEVYFTADGSDTENQLYTVTASYVKIEAVGSKGISGAEIDLITPPGDNVEATSNDIFKLSEDYVYEKGTNGAEDKVIPAGSVVIKAEYRGNPAYNVATIADKDGKLINIGLAEEGTTTSDVYNEIFTATIPEYPLTEVSKGYLIIYMTEEVYNKVKTSYADGIRLNLYRVNNAETNEGERLVSDTKLIKLPETLKSGTITSGTKMQGASTDNKVTDTNSDKENTGSSL